MNNIDSLLFDDADLYLLLADDEMSDTQFDKIRALLKDNEAARDYYYRMMNLEVLLRDSKGLAEESRKMPYQEVDFWQILAHEEKTAPSIEVPPQKPEHELIQKVVYPPQERRKMSKFQIFTLAMSAAAILFVVLFVKLNPPRPYSVEVATLIDQMGAKWAEFDTVLKTGSRLWTNEEPLHLEKGIIRIQYDDGVDVLVEGPAVFGIDMSGMFLEYGRLYSRVSKVALGFTVKTPTSQFVDHGTEFGIKADIDGSSELHVIKGKVQLFAGSKGGSKTGCMVTENQAVRYYAESSLIKEIPIQKETYVRFINSGSKIVWRGQKALSLADIVGGGSGLGGGVINAGVNPTTGNIQTSLLNFSPFKGPAGYKRVDNNPYIDGVFVPGADGDKTFITSEASYAVAFPHASGRLWGYIFNGAFHQGTAGARSPLKLGGVVLGTPEHPAMTIHSNQGITFDLSEIRKNLPASLSITAFRSLVGISQTAQELLEKRPNTVSSETDKRFEADNSKVEFWVFLDGKQVFHREISSAEEAAELEIPIPTDVRFLTLAVTESDDGVPYDWALFGRPELTLESVTKAL